MVRIVGRTWFVAGLLVVLESVASGQTPLATAFTYQGQLKQSGVPLDGYADFRFSVWNALSGGQQVGAEYPVKGVTVANGLFTTRVDPGVNVFTGDARWVQVAARYPTGTGSFVTLAPRQSLTAAPYALHSRDTRGIFVASDGKIGLGTTSPKQALHVAGDYYGKGHLWLHAYEGDGSSGAAYVQARDDSGSSSIDLRLRTQSNGATVETMTLKSSGNVGIGTSAPEQKLDVNGVARFSAGAGPNLIIHDSNSGPDRPGIQFTNNSAHYIAGDGLSNEAFGFYSNYGNARAYDATLSIYGNTQGTFGTWGRYLSLTHDGTDGRISTDTGHILLQPAGSVGVATGSPLAPLHLGSTGSNWNWTAGNGWGDFCLGNGSVGLAMGVTTSGGGTGDVRLWTKGGSERLVIGNSTDDLIMTIDDARVGIPSTYNYSRLNATSLGHATYDYAAHFKDANGTGEAWLAGDDAAGREYGIVANGAKAGGFFKDTDGAGEARVAYSDGDNVQYGVWARGETGGYFETSAPSGSKAWIGGIGSAISGEGDFGGGYFKDTLSSGWANVGSGSFKIQGNGGVSFVQNHPQEPDRVIVYTALEGDEVATYTRGTARLVGGQAVVELGETFRWVTNPDIGLTAHLTPRGECEGLFVESLTTGELVVRELRGGRSGVVFDYIVHGLRIGFEEVSTVQEKTRDARIPSMASHRERYLKRPELRKYNALERFKVMRTNVGVRAPLDMTAATALRDAIVEFDPAVHKIERSGMPSAEGMPRALHKDESHRSRDPQVVGSTTQIAGTSGSRDGEIEEWRARVETLAVMIARLSAAHKEGAR
jgi:hypothetical protein